MKLISWNVNGLRACLQKGFLGVFSGAGRGCSSVFRRQSFRQGQSIWSLPGYHQYWNYAEKKGYSGTAVFTKEEPPDVRAPTASACQSMTTRAGLSRWSIPDFYLVTVYTPNAQEGPEAGLTTGWQWEDAFRGYISGQLDQKKPRRDLWRPECGPCRRST